MSKQNLLSAFSEILWNSLRPVAEIFFNKKTYVPIVVQVKTAPESFLSNRSK